MHPCQKAANNSGNSIACCCTRKANRHHCRRFATTTNGYWIQKQKQMYQQKYGCKKQRCQQMLSTVSFPAHQMKNATNSYPCAPVTRNASCKIWTRRKQQGMTLYQHSSSNASQTSSQHLSLDYADACSMKHVGHRVGNCTFSAQFTKEHQHSQQATTAVYISLASCKKSPNMLSDNTWFCGCKLVVLASINGHSQKNAARGI